MGGPHRCLSILFSVLDTLSLPYGIKGKNGKPFFCVIQNDMLIPLATITITGMPAAVDDDWQFFPLQVFPLEKGSRNEIAGHRLEEYVFYQNSIGFHARGDFRVQGSFSRKFP